MDNTAQGEDICKVCRSEGTPERPLFHPCLCTGTIKHIHQECLVQWMRYSRKEYCELCNYQFSFTSIYAPEMPQRIPIKDVAAGITSSIFTAIKYCVHFSLVVLVWICFVPCTACWIYCTLFNGSLDGVITLPFDKWSSKNILDDILHGSFVTTCTLFAFFGLTLLQEQILHGGGPEWLEGDEQNNQQQLNVLFPPIPEENHFDEGDGEIHPENENQIIEGLWNPLDLGDIEAEDLALKQFLGLDGSLVFLKIVVGIVFLNALFITVFAFCPYRMGILAITALALQDKVAASHIEGLMTTLCGYCLIGMCLLIMHTFATIIGLKRSKRILGLSYIIVKVFLLIIVHIGVIPLVCGWWLDICSLPMFDSSFKDRLATFHRVTVNSIIIHWLVGIIFVNCFAAFLFLLQKVVRPGVLWFLQHLYNEDFSPIKDLIQQGMLQSGRSLIASVMIFGTAVFIVVWLPIRIIKFAWPSFLPLYVTLHRDFVKPLYMELFLFLIVFLLLEITHTSKLLKMGIRYWCYIVSSLLGIKSYLLGDGEGQHPVIALIHLPEADLGAAHEELLRRGRLIGFQPYTKPSCFSIRLIVLLILVALSMVIFSLLVITIPVWLGRLTMSFWPVLLAIASETFNSLYIHRLYMASWCTFICWLSVAVVYFIAKWLPEKRTAVINQMKLWLKIGSKAMVLYIVFVGIIPFLLGILHDLVILVPFRVPLHQTPVLRVWQVWELGVTLTEISAIILLLGPDCYLRRALEHFLINGFIHFDLKLMMNDLALPVIAVLSLFLALPYVIAHSVVPLIVKHGLTRLLVTRGIYPIFMLFVIIAKGMLMLVRQFKRLYKHIKNEKYLMDRRLVNYNHTSSVSS